MVAFHFVYLCRLCGLGGNSTIEIIVKLNYDIKSSVSDFLQHVNWGDTSIYYLNLAYENLRLVQN